MIELQHKDLLLQLRKYPSIFELLLSLTPEHRKSISAIAAWPDVLVQAVANNPEHLSVLHKIWDYVDDKQKFIDGYLAATEDELFDEHSMLDAFSIGQMRSKNWLVQNLCRLQLELGRTWILCGWIGMLGYMLLDTCKHLKLHSVRSFDIDPRCAVIADKINKHSVMDKWVFKASTLDVNEMTYDGFMYQTLKHDGSSHSLVGRVDTIINTSTDHLADDRWFKLIKPEKLVILQNNDLHSIEEHTNSVNDIDEFAARYPMQHLLYKGTLKLDSYRRFMLIGYK